MEQKIIREARDHMETFGGCGDRIRQGVRWPGPKYRVLVEKSEVVGAKAFPFVFNVPSNTTVRIDKAAHLG